MRTHTSQEQWNSILPFGYQQWGWPDRTILHAGPNDGGVKRGDREDTGDNQAAPDEIGTDPAGGTVDSTSLGGETSITSIPPSGFDVDSELSDSSDGMEIMEANDGRLGLTGLPDSPAEDWAADTGETRNPNK